MAASQPLSRGTVVKFRGNPLGYRNRFAIVLEHDHRSGSVKLQTEGSDDALAARHEVVVVRNPPADPLRFLRHRLPYGKWTCKDGREVLFNRNYKPLWQRHPGQPAEPADRDEIVKFDRQEWFYDGACQPWRKADAERRCNLLLTAWGLPPV